VLPLATFYKEKNTRCVPPPKTRSARVPSGEGGSTLHARLMLGAKLRCSFPPPSPTYKDRLSAPRWLKSAHACSMCVYSHAEVCAALAARVAHAKIFGSYSLSNANSFSKAHRGFHWAHMSLPHRPGTTVALRGAHTRA
jgi:hypothetical protein